MSVIQDNSITSNNIQPASGQALTIKDEGGTASITVAINGEATFAEKIHLSSGKGIVFSATNNPAQSSGTGVSNILDDYEEGTWTPTNTTSASIINAEGQYTKIGRLVYLEGYFQTHSSTEPSNTFGGLPFVIGATEPARSGGWTSYNQNVAETYSILVSSSGNTAFSFYSGSNIIILSTSRHMYFSIQYITTF